jgi:hypothetical protein
MRDLFEERGTDSTEILNQVQDDEPSVGIFRDDKVALASTLNSHLEATAKGRLSRQPRRHAALKSKVCPPWLSVWHQVASLKESSLFR